MQSPRKSASLATQFEQFDKIPISSCPVFYLNTHTHIYTYTTVGYKHDRWDRPRSRWSRYVQYRVTQVVMSWKNCPTVKRTSGAKSNYEWRFFHVVTLWLHAIPTSPCRSTRDHRLFILSISISLSLSFYF